MNIAMDQALTMGRGFEQPAWKNLLNWTAAVLIAIVFLAAGLFHILDPFGAAVLMTNLKLPQAISIPFAIGLGTVETFTGLLFLIPRYRKWASWLGTILLLAFMVYIGYFYNELRGADCSCFPWVKRAVSPAFFLEDGIMLVLAIVAGMWTVSARRLRLPALLLGIVAVFAVVSFGVASSRQSGTRAPDTVTVNGKAYNISTGKVFIYFYDPECMYCVEAGERMAKMNWGDTKFVGQPIINPQFAPAFMERTGLKGVTASNFDTLGKTFAFKRKPAGVAIENGRQVAALTQFAAPEPVPTLQKLGFAK